MEKEDNHYANILLINTIEIKIKKRVFKKRGYKLVVKEILASSTLFKNCFPTYFGESISPSLDKDTMEYDVVFKYGQ